jgi:TonB-linked SusC/RagA family outer membrane protein
MIVNRNNFIQIFILALALTTAKSVFSQDTITITGHVLGIQNQPLENVEITVDVQGSNSYYTGPDGVFSLRTAAGPVWLLVNPVGNYKPKRILVDGTDKIEIKLVSENRQSQYDPSDELFDQRPKREITNAVDYPVLDGIQNFSYNSLDQFLQARISGFHVTGHSGFPGSGSFGIIRGLRSLNANAEPLIIVDGIPLGNEVQFSPVIDGYSFDPLMAIPPMDISSVSIVKDGFLSAEYGTRASNGIIHINTLIPEENITTINLGLRLGFNFKPQPIPVLKGTQYRSLVSEILGTSSILEEDYEELFPGLYSNVYRSDYYRYANETDWQDKVFEDALFNDLYLSIKGGDEIAKYGLSVISKKVDNIVRNTSMNLTNLRLVTDFSIFEWLKMGISANIGYNDSNLKEFGSNPISNPILSALAKAPIMQAFEAEENGDLLPYYDEVDGFGVSNPASIVEVFKASRDNYRFNGKFNLDANLTSKLDFSILGAYNLNTFRESIFYPDAGMELYNDKENYNIVKQQDSNFGSLYTHAGLKYKSEVSDNGKIFARIGSRIYTNQFQEDIGITMDTPSDEYQSLASGTRRYSRNYGDIGRWNTATLYGTANYSYLDRYYMGVTISVDGSSRTGKEAATTFNFMNTPFGVFPGVSAAWRFSEVGGLKRLSWLDNAKLRLSYSISGNDDIGAYESRSTYSQVLYRERTGLILSSIPNKQLKFETVINMNAGLDISVFNERILLQVDLFNIVTNDMLIFERRRDYEGYRFSATNGGKMGNRGFDLSMITRLVETSTLDVDLGINISKYYNEVLLLNGGEILTELDGGTIISREGYPANSFFGYRAKGIFATQDEAEAANLVSAKGIPFRAGDVWYEDINEDGFINEEDKVILGSPNPDLFGGISLDIGWKRWSLSSMMQLVYGNEVFNYVRYQGERMTDFSNQWVSVLNRWQYEGHITDIPRARYDDPVGNSDFSSRWIEDGSFLRWKNLTFAYTIPESILFFKNLKIYLTAHNLLVWTKYLGYDPEFSHTSKPLYQGIDYGNSPHYRSFMIGVNVGL